MEDRANHKYALPLPSVVAGILYLAAAWWQPFWSRLLSGGAQPTLGEVQSGALSFFAREALIYLPAVAVLLVAYGHYDGKAPTVTSVRVGWKRYLLGALTAGAAGFVLDAFQIWPWIWRFDLAASTALARVVWHPAQWLALLLWVLVWTIVLPTVEEYVFMT